MAYLSCKATTVDENRLL